MTFARALAAGLTVVAALLQGCSDSGPSEGTRIGSRLLDTLVTPETPPPAEPPTRAELESLDSAVIAVSSAEGALAYIVPLAVNGPYESYYDSARRAVVLRGGAVARTHGLGFYLRGVRFAEEDPIATPRPLESWPGQVDREYQFRVRDLHPYTITLTCVYQRGPRRGIEIVGRRHEVVEVTETCRNARRTVTNRYDVAPQSGFIWRSTQWRGPDVPPLDIAVVRPFRG